jgi:hypothetical protein
VSAFLGGAKDFKQAFFAAYDIHHPSDFALSRNRDI